MADTPDLFFGPFRLDPRQRKLWRDKQLVDLQPKPLAVLQYLLEHPNRVVPKEELLKYVWTGVYVTNTALKVCIRAIREALGEEVDAPRYLETMGREGYRFIGEVVSSQHSVAGGEEESQSAKVKTQGSKVPPFLPAPSTQPLAPLLVGREAELTQLHRLLGKAAHGERQIVFVTGEAGVGKTTLIDVFLPAVRNPQSETTSSLKPLAPVFIGRGQCLEQYGEGEAYLPVLEALGQLCRGPGGSHVLATLSRYAPTWLVQMPTLVAETELESLQRKSAGATRERMLREMAEALEALTAEWVLLLVFEDLHWSDRATVELLSYLGQRRAQAKLLVLGTYRPVEVVLKDHPFKGIKQELDAHGQCHEVALELLTQAEVEEYLAKRFPASPAATEVARVIHQRTDGNALFMVNVVDYCLHRNLLVQEGDEWKLKGDLGEGGIPNSLQQMIAKQLERLTEDERKVMEVASVVGKEFSTAVVAAALGGESDTIEDICEMLAYRGQLLREQGISEWPDGTVSGRYGFRHVLYQNVLYQRVAEARRVRLHRLIGTHEERLQGVRAPELAAELAMHFERGRDFRRAVPYLYAAGQNALRRSAYQEAITYLTQGVGLVRTLPDTPECAQQELLFQTALGPVFMLTQSYASPEAEQAYTRARELCQQVGESHTLFSILFGLWRVYHGRADARRAHESAEQLRRAAQNVQDPIPLLGVYYALGVTAFHYSEEFARARVYWEKMEALYSPSQHRAQGALYGADMGVIGKAYLALTLCLLGYPQQAAQKAQEAITLAQSLTHPASQASALFFALLGHQHRGEEPLVQERAAELIALCQEYGFRHWLANCMSVQGWLLTDHGQIEQGLATLRTLGSRIGLTLQIGLLADAYGKAGRREEALKAVEEGLTIVQSAGEQAWGAELYRLKGKLTLQSSVERRASSVQKQQTANSKQQTAKNNAHSHLRIPDFQGEAAECFLKAIKMARQQQAKWLELRAIVDLARLWQQQALEQGARSAKQGAWTKLAEAHSMLSEIYSWFTEGFDTKDLQEAKALLEDLGETTKEGKGKNLKE